MEESRSSITILTGKRTGKITPEWPGYRWEDYVRMNLKETGVSRGNYIDSAQDREY